MKRIRTYQLLSLLSIWAFLTLWGCRREVEVPVPTPIIQGKASAASLGGLVTGGTGSDKLDFQVDVYVVDRSGRYVKGLNRGNFVITSSAPSSYTYTLSKLDVVGQTAKTGGYSAMMLMDQSGSILSTDPKNLRVDAGKVFLDFLGSNDVAALASFTGAYNRLYRTHYGFSRNTTPMKKTLDSLASLAYGGTPLYYSASAMVDYTSTNAKTTNKAIIVFTDGEDTYGSVSLTQLVTSAKAKSVPLYTVGLSNEVNEQVLAQMANETGGAFFYAKDAEQLLTSFGTLGNLLRGAASLYRTTWTAARRTGKWVSGNEVAETIKVTIPNGDVIEVPFYVRVP